MKKIVLSLILLTFTSFLTAQEPCDCVGYITYFGGSVALGTPSGERIEFYTVYKPEQELCIKNTYSEKAWNGKLRKDFIRAIQSHKVFKDNNFSGNIKVVADKNELLEKNISKHGLRDKFKTNNYYDKQIEIKLDFINALSSYQLCSDEQSSNNSTQNTSETNTQENIDIESNQSSNKSNSENVYDKKQQDSKQVMQDLDRFNETIRQNEASSKENLQKLTNMYETAFQNWEKEKQFQSQLTSYTSINSTDPQAIIKEAKKKSQEINITFGKRKNELLNQGTAATQKIIGAAKTEKQVVGGAIIGTGLTILGQVSAEKQRKQAQQKLENEKQLAIKKIVQPIIQKFKIYKEKMLKAASLSVFENEEIYYMKQYDYANCMQKNANKVVESNYSCVKPKSLKPKKVFNISGQNYYDSYKRKRKSEITDIFDEAEKLLELAIEKEPNSIDWLYEKSKLTNIDVFDKFLILQKLKRLRPENLTFVSELNKIEKKLDLNKEKPNYLEKIKDLEKESKMRKKISSKIKKSIKAKPWTILGNTPIFPGCKKNKKTYKNKECFSNKLRNHFDKETNFKILKENNIKRIFIALLISHKGEFTLTSIRTLKKNILPKTVIAEIERVITLLPQLEPTIIDNDPITIKYSLPLIIK